MTDAAIADFSGRVLVIAPHMDDESLGCGLLLAGHPDKSRVHVVFATDGSRSPEQTGSERAHAAELMALRASEAREAISVLGIPSANAHFLEFEDGSLSHCGTRLAETLIAHVRDLDPEHVFVPFRYDWHPDHIAVNRAVCAARDRGHIGAGVVEYFVYSQRKLLPRGDIRAYLRTEAVRSLGPGPEPVARLKRRAIECHRSQTTCHFGWQTRPILTPELVARVCAESEVYLLYDPARPGRAVFSRAAAWIPLANRLEPALKRWKDRRVGWKGA